jgi:hypothetical protein
MVLVWDQNSYVAGGTWNCERKKGPCFLNFLFTVPVSQELLQLLFTSCGSEWPPSLQPGCIFSAVTFILTTEGTFFPEMLTSTYTIQKTADWTLATMKTWKLVLIVMISSWLLTSKDWHFCENREKNWNLELYHEISYLVTVMMVFYKNTFGDLLVG